MAETGMMVMCRRDPILKRLVYGREVLAVTVLDLSDCAALPWAEQAGEVFEAEGQRSM